MSAPENKSKLVIPGALRSDLAKSLDGAMDITLIARAGRFANAPNEGPHDARPVAPGSGAKARPRIRDDRNALRLGHADDEGPRPVHP